MPWALLTLDLHRASPQKRRAFDKAMESLGWIKVATVSTAWAAEFERGAKVKDATIEARSDIKQAANYASIKLWDAIVQIGPERPRVF